MEIEIDVQAKKQLSRNRDTIVHAQRYSCRTEKIISISVIIIIGQKVDQIFFYSPRLNMLDAAIQNKFVT